MHIERVTIENYKSFFRRQQLSFEPGFNILVGSNNAGKTTVLDVLDMDPGLNEPHRSEATIPTFGAVLRTQSSHEVAIRSNIVELRSLVGPTMFLPLSGVPTGTQEEQVMRVRGFMDGNKSILLTHRAVGGRSWLRVKGDDFVSGEADRQSAEGFWSAQVLANPDGIDRIEIARFAVQQQIGAYVDQYRQRVYRFSAQRRPGTEIGAQGSPVLDREAATLPYCINHLQTNDAYGHRVLCGWVKRIFPNVEWVQAPPNGGSFQIRCLPRPPEARREDLSTPMAKMGAGIGNVLAMLYVVLTARHPQVIAIDEPNAFLHPRALRELLAILEAEGKQHQFIVTAHSADVLTAVDAKTVTLLELNDAETTAKQVGLRELHQLRGGLADLGIRMTDLHAKDRVLWVEGQTEEIVLPDILKWACPEVAAGTAVLRVERTGTFDKKGVDPIELTNIYDRLSGASALVPPMVSILLDRETRKAEERAALQRASNGRLSFLDRRMLENYLVHPLAISLALRELGVDIGEGQVAAQLASAFGAQNLAEVDLVAVDAAAALKETFSSLSEAKEEFRKTRDVPVITSHILRLEPEYLAPLRTLLRALMRI